jgi:hypothetical protein
MEGSDRNSSPASSRGSAETLIRIKWELGRTHRAAARDFATLILSGLYLWKTCVFDLDQQIKGAFG